MVKLSHLYMTTGKIIALTILKFISKVLSLLFNTLSRFVIAFLPRTKWLFISWLQSPSAVILEPPPPKKQKVYHCFHFSPSICHEVMGSDTMIFVFFMLSFKTAFLLSSFTLIKRLFSSSLLFCHYSGVICIFEVIDISPSNLDFNLWFIQPSISHEVLCIWVK